MQHFCTSKIIVKVCYYPTSGLFFFFLLLVHVWIQSKIVLTLKVKVVFPFFNKSFHEKWQLYFVVEENVSQDNIINQNLHLHLQNYS